MPAGGTSREPANARRDGFHKIVRSISRSSADFARNGSACSRRFAKAPGLDGGFKITANGTALVQVHTVRGRRRVRRPSWGAAHEVGWAREERTGGRLRPCL